MNTAAKSGCLKTLLKIGLILVVLLFVILLVALLVLPGPIATRTVNDVLDKVLVVDSEVGKIRAALPGGRVSVHDLSIAQPDGFEGDTFVRLDEARVKIRPGSLLNQPIVVKEVVVKTLDLNLEKATNGLFNAVALTGVPQAAPGSGGDGDSADTGEDSAPGDVGEPATEAEEAAGSPPPAVELRSLRAETLNISYIDHSLNPKQPLNLSLRNVKIEGSDILFDPTGEPDGPLNGTLTMTGETSLEDMSPGFIGLTVRLGTLGTNIPSVVAGLALAGFELAAVDGVIPPGVKTTLGGKALDLAFELQLASDLLNVDGVVVTQGGTFPVKVGGTPDTPAVNAGAALFGVFGRAGGVVGNVAGNMAGAGMEAGKGIADAGGKAVSGVGKIASSAGKGLLGTAGSLVKGDIKGAGKGLADSAAEMGKGAVDTVKETGSAAGKGVASVGGAGLGLHSADRWNEGKKERFDEMWDVLQAFVAETDAPQPAK